MPGDNENSNNNMSKTSDAVGGTVTNQKGSAGARTGEVQQKELPSKFSAVTGARTFIKHNTKEPKTEAVQPTPWPMPPRIKENQSATQSATSGSPKKEADREYLTPLSSFAQQDEDISLQANTLPTAESYCESSDTFSRESSVKRESFSSVETGASLAFAGSSDSASSESVNKVDIDADEFTHFLSERTSSSQSAVNFAQLFAEEDQRAENGNTIQSKAASSSEVSENSTTPKAMRAPFRYRKSTKAKGNTVSLEEALEFSPDYKTLGTKHTTPTHNEASESAERELQGLQAEEPEGVENGARAESGLRRPMASRRKSFIILPLQKEEASSRPNESAKESGKRTSTVSERNETKEQTQSSRVAETTPPVKGVIMRNQSHVSHVAGIRKAETGRIMSRAELRTEKPIMLQESPNPKSLKPGGFRNEEEDIGTLHPYTLFPNSSSDSDKNMTEKPSSSKQSTNEQLSTKKRSENRNASSPSCTKVDDGSFLSPGILSRKKKYGTEEYRIDSFQFSEHEGSSGLLNRFSSGFRKVHLAVSKKSSSQKASPAGESAIVVSGTIDEAVCKICVVCRKQLEYDVYVKDTGKKIKVESRKDGKSRHLRATILVRQLPGVSSCCEVYIRQSRSDGMKTSLATLWNFYQRLEAGLKELG